MRFLSYVPVRAITLAAMDDHRSRVARLCAIYTLPFDLGWVGELDPAVDDPYHYWRRLDLLDQPELEAVFRERKVEPNPRIEQFFRNMDLHFAPQFYAGEHVADVGSGYGFMTMWTLVNGAGLVHSIGDPKRIAFLERLYAAAVERELLPQGRLRSRGSFFHAGEESLSSTIVPGSLKLVLLTDTLEHITPRLLPSLARAAHNGLANGGRFISKQSNTSSPAALRRLKRFWEEIERTTSEPQRMRLIAERLPSADPEQVRELARRTRGADRPDFVNAMDRFAKDGTMPPEPGELPSIDVEIDVPLEGDTDIERIMEVFRGAGFTHRKVYPDTTSSRRSRFLQPLARAVPQAFLSLHLFDMATVFVFTK